ncbi:MAG: hypothetical protein LBC52_02400 [Treponema sp.]|jgi:hypothetical protein|nr:hypothetical protein [Treponema sp.]
MKNKRFLAGIISILLTIGLVLASCGDNDDPDDGVLYSTLSGTYSGQGDYGDISCTFSGRNYAISINGYEVEEGGYYIRESTVVYFNPDWRKNDDWRKYDGTYTGTLSGSNNSKLTIEGIIFTKGNNNSGGNNNASEGIYMGIIKFAGEADDLNNNAPILLDASGTSTLSNKLDQYVIASQSGTALYYAVHKALANLKSNETSYPSKLDSVYVVTFTDGLDNASSGRSAFTPIESKTFNTTADYATFVKGEITNRRIAGKEVTAYSIGVRGSDVTDIPGFQSSLANIASPGKNQELTDFSAVQTTFNNIADGLNITNTTTSFIMVTTMLDSSTKVRMTFDVTADADAASSAKYIEGTINRSGTTYTLNNITYAGGISSGVGTGPITGTINGSEVKFIFDNIIGYNTSTDRPSTRQWLMAPGSSAWQINSEYSSEGSSTSTVERRSAIIYLVLDCSTSMDTNNIARIRNAANTFITSIYNRYTSGSSGTGGNNGGSGNNGTPTTLSQGVWANGNITQSAPFDFYQVNVTAGTTYYIWWNDQFEGNGTKTLDVLVSASGFSDVDSGWFMPMSFTAGGNGIFLLTVKAYNFGDTGTYAIAYSTTNSRP